MTTLRASFSQPVHIHWTVCRSDIAVLDKYYCEETISVEGRDGWEREAMEFGDLFPKGTIKEIL
jgi:hypothetical protein